MDKFELNVAKLVDKKIQKNCKRKTRKIKTLKLK
ncbi:hypothetical protein Calhy_0232 [Caldicellulosiruptor hydrothermalis 108]|uniref:Uncharacterized protein n=1 Tax=Caldicellulosiruptor hydrothermalis (strain DSM 18901 / VKM B-2411 / 108) TaxID=632292 RepID=E4QB11_CALH1|nr:hypothetical protein Calhy_0232 [Caldicellulosiruptor hydrothermalis 108]